MPDFTETFDIHIEARDVTITVEIDSTLRHAEDPGGYGAHRVGAEGEITHIQINKVEYVGDADGCNELKNKVYWLRVVQEHLDEQEYIRDLIVRKL